MRRRRTKHGFTLVELLVVIAIIGILAGFIAAGYPRVIRMAKTSAMNSNMSQIRTILIEYYARTNSFPPAYGYLSPLFLKDPGFVNPQTRPGNILTALGNAEFSESDAFFLYPWMSFVREHGNDDLYDNWSRGNSYDTDGDGVISRLEFAPRGVFNSVAQAFDFDYTQLYQGGNTSTDPVTDSDVTEQLNTQDTRPFIYLTVNERQTRQFRKIMYDFAARQGNPSNPRPFNLDAPAIFEINQLSFPPASYDEFVLMSVGPNFLSGTNGLVVEFGVGTLNLADFPTVYQYHILGLATHFLATRDAENGGEGDSELDFDFSARTSRGQGKNADNDMPGQFPKGDGPVIYVGGV